MPQYNNFIDNLFKLQNAFASGEKTEKLFFNAVKEAFYFHYKNSPFYKSICAQNSFSPDNFENINDIAKIPYIFVDVLKQYKILSVPEKDIVFKLLSSGTKGVTSQIMWDGVSMRRQAVMREKEMESLNLVSRVPARYMIFSYDYAQSRGRGAAYAHEMYSAFAPALEKFYALRIREKGEDFSFNLNESAGKLEEMAQGGEPVRVIGFPSFTYFTVKELMRKHKNLPLPAGSLIINGGGWKLRPDAEIPKDKYRKELSEFFKIPQAGIRDVFGMVEHGVPYISCAKGNFHEPVYSKILLRHPLTGKILPDGRHGLLQFITPYIRSMPSFSLLSSDLGYLLRGCPCGIKKPYFTVLRRAGTALYKGCALTAAELIK